jgi:hypothetical protein
VSSRVAIIVVLAVAILGGAVWWALQPARPDAGWQPAHQQRAHQQRAHQQPANQQPANQQPANQQPAHQQRAHQQPANQQPASQQPAHEQPEHQQPAHRDAGSQPAHQQPKHPQPATNEWADPTNQQVLGRKSWMAPVEETEQARIDQVFEDSRAARYDPRLPNASRAASVEAARQAVDACFTALKERTPTAKGRLIVAWRAGAENGRGWIRDPRISVNYGLEDPMFEACVLDGVARQTFRGVDGDAIDVEVPFFYDGSF